MNWWMALRGILGRLDNIERMLNLLLAQGTHEMAAIDDLQTAVTDLQTEVGAVATQMDTLLADLTAALATNNTTAISAATVAIQAQVDALKAASTRDMPPAVIVPGP